MIIKFIFHKNLSHSLIINNIEKIIDDVILFFIDDDEMNKKIN